MVQKTFTANIIASGKVDENTSLAIRGLVKILTRFNTMFCKSENCIGK
jgi:hypothetical protein